MAALALAAGPAAGADASALYGSCFRHAYDAAAGKRVTFMSVQFQGFDESLLASVVYSLRYGIKFGFSGACEVEIEGGYLCEACTNNVCAAGGETFKLLWSGGDSVRLVNDTTGVLGENAEGGRDYLRADSENRLFVLERGDPKDCAW